MKTNRPSLSKRVRFEVFKRDSFKCQYCGRSAPDVVLNVDHIQPVAGGGDSEITNLITSCFDCNSGKSDKILSDDSAAKKRKAQLDLLQDRREQIGMMADWQRGLIDLDQEALEHCHQLWRGVTPGFSLNDNGLKDMAELIRKFGMAEVMIAIRISAQYLKRSDDGRIDKESAENAISKIGGICVIEGRAKQDPGLREAYQLRAFLRKVLGFDARSSNDAECLEFINALRRAGYSIEHIRCSIRGADTFYRFTKVCRRMLEEAN